MKEAKEQLEKITNEINRTDFDINSFNARDLLQK